MAENFNFNGRICADVADFLPVQLPAQHHPLHPQGSAQLHSSQGMDGHLGGAVDGDIGGNLAAQLRHAQILDNESIHPCLGGFSDQVGNSFEFPVSDQGVQGQMHIHTPNMAVFQCFSQRLQGKVFCALAGVKGADAQIHGIRAVLDRSTQRIHGTGGGQ